MVKKKIAKSYYSYHVSPDKKGFQNLGFGASLVTFFAQRK